MGVVMIKLGWLVLYCNKLAHQAVISSFIRYYIGNSADTVHFASYAHWYNQ